MKVTTRKRLIETSLIGICFTIAVIIMDQLHMLAPFERWLGDQRARYFQYHMPDPTDRLVHIDIDDRSLEVIGRWPWRRDVLAQIVDEIRLADTKVVAMDLVFSEKQKPRSELVDVFDQSIHMSAARMAKLPDQTFLRQVNDDRRFADAIDSLDSVLIPFNMIISRTVDQTPIQHQVHDMLIEDLELTLEEVQAKLKADAKFPADEIDKINTWFHPVQQEAFFRRLDSDYHANPDDAFTNVRQRLLPKTDPRLTDSVELRLLRSQHDKVLSVNSMRRFARIHEDNLPPLLTAEGIVASESELVPIPTLSDVATNTGFVTYLHRFDGGVVRALPLTAKYRNYVFPQLGLAMACSWLGVDFKDVILGKDQIVIPIEDGDDIVVPVRSPYIEYLDRHAGTFMDIPWFGEHDDWYHMYDRPGRSPQHISLARIWKICQVRHRIELNNASVDPALVFFKAIMVGDEAAQEYLSKRPAASQWPKRRDEIQKMIKEIAESGFLEAYQELSPEEIAADEGARQFLESHRALTLILSENDELTTELAAERDDLRKHLEGRAAIVGWTATASIADFVKTSLHYQCPGVVVHGAIFNSIITGEHWQTGPRWADILLTILLGLLMTLIVAAIPPVPAATVAVVLGVGYYTINGYFLFDLNNIMVGLAGPLTAVVLCWSGGTLIRFVIEATERARITRRFRSYVDTSLVDYVIEHPEQARLDGQLKELSVVFTDLAGFTTISERLQERTVPLLNEYMELMVPAIRRHKGYVNKFMGDGIMFFHGAPYPSDEHAKEAVEASIEMQEVLVSFNETLSKRDLPNVKMRVGIGTGNMVVGDAGSNDASDYTVLGDVVNTGARLESANKATGSLMMVLSRTKELCGDHVLFRPIGKLQVVGKSEGVMCWEPLGFVADATDDQKQLTDLTIAMVEPYLVGDFEACIAAANKMEQALGSVKLATLYRGLSEEYKLNLPDSFDGQIVLSSK